MTFTPGMPFDGQTLGNSKPLVRNNFTALSNAEAVDHVPLNQTDAGKHTGIHLIPFSSSSPPAVSGREIVLYNRDVGSNQAIFYRSPSGSQIQFSITTNLNPGIQLSTVTPATNLSTNNGYLSSLPGGFVEIGGVATFTAANTPSPITVTLPISVSAFLSIQVQTFNTIGATTWAAMGTFTTGGVGSASFNFVPVFWNGSSVAPFNNAGFFWRAVVQT